MKKRLLLLFTFLVAIASGTWAESYSIWIGGTQVTSDNATDVLSNGTVSYDASTSTLTLNNANITTACAQFGRSGYGWGTRTGIRVAQDIVIRLVGENVIDLRALTYTSVMRHAIFSTADITFIGTGSLRVYPGNATNNGSSDYRESTGIHVEGKLTFDDNVSVWSEGNNSQCDSSGVRGDMGVFVKGNANVVAIGGTVTVRARLSTGSWSNVTVESGTFVSYGEMFACTNDITVPNNGNSFIYAGESIESLELQPGITTINGTTVKCVKAIAGGIPAGLAISEENFPDATFRTFLQGQEYGTDGVLTDEEISAIKTLNLNAQGISSLEGIKNFTALETLFCAENSLEQLDVAGMTSLTTLTCNNNQLTSLDVTGCTALQDLNCYYNQLTTLDVSGMTSLTSLYCYNNKLESLNVTGCSKLETLLAAVNQLTTLDLSTNSWLTLITIYENKIGIDGMETLINTLPEPSSSFPMLVVVNSASDNEQNEMTKAQVDYAKENGYMVLDNNGYADYEGIIIPTEEITLTIKTETKARENFENKEYAALGAICTLVLQEKEEGPGAVYSTKEGKLLFSVMRAYNLVTQKAEVEFTVADDVSEADNFTYELTAADRETLSHFYMDIEDDGGIDIPSIVEAKGINSMATKSVTVSEVLAEVKSITVQFVPNPPKDPEPYAVLSKDGKTLNIYYDTEKKARGGVSIEDGWNAYRTTVTMANIDESMADYATLTSTAGWFEGCFNLKNINGIQYLNTTNVTDMSGMFKGCSSLNTINISSFNTSKVTDMSAMFWDCSGLTSLDLSNFDTRNVTGMSGMFYYCNKLNDINLTSFNTAKVNDMSTMFYYCQSLTELDLRSFNTGKVTSMLYMFEGCRSLKSIAVSESGWQTSKLETGRSMFTGCYSLVGGNGTTYNATKTDEEYACIDKTGSAGYLTDDAATGITNITGNGSVDSNAAYYTPDGRKIIGKPARQGMYITNGLKVVVK